MFKIRACKYLKVLRRVWTIVTAPRWSLLWADGRVEVSDAKGGQDLPSTRGAPRFPPVPAQSELDDAHRPKQLQGFGGGEIQPLGFERFLQGAME